jgi:hypothetical protein
MPSIDALIVGLIVLLICGAAIFYLYMRISFYERKGSMMESVIVDLKVAIDSLMSSGQGGGAAPVPISPTPEPAAPVELSAPVPLESSESEDIPEESFYSSVLEQAHETVPEGGVTLDKVMETLDADEAAEPDLDAMTKNDLLALAEKRGLRAKKSATRTEILNLLRRSSPLQNSGMTAGADNGSTAAALDGSVVDLGQGGASLE